MDQSERKPAPIRPAEPVKPTFIESFNGLSQDQRVNVCQITSPVEAQAMIDAW